MMPVEFAQGRFWCRVVGQGMSVAKSGNEQFWIQIEPVGQVDPANPDGDLIRCPQGKTRTVFRAITANTIEWLKKDLAYLVERSGKTVVIGGFEFLDPNTPGYVDFSNAEIEAMCDHELYEGKTREKWSIAAGGGMVAKPLEQASIRKLNAMFGKELKSLGSPATAPKDATAQPGVAPIAPMGRAKQKPPETVPAYLAESEAFPTDDIPF